MMLSSSLKPLNAASSSQPLNLWILNEKLIVPTKTQIVRHLISVEAESEIAAPKGGQSVDGHRIDFDLISTSLDFHGTEFA
jgi:hypothetical protein